MPKRGNNKGGNRNWKLDGGGREGKYYFEHDDRVGDSNRRVSFKQGSNRKHNNSRKFNLAIRAHLEDDDVDMGGAGSSNRDRYNNIYPGRGHGMNNRGYGGGGRRRPNRNSPPLPSQNRKRFSDHTLSWFRVHIPHGAQYSKDYIMKTLLSHVSPDIFIPLCYQIQGIDASFFVEDSRVAEKIANADKRITTHKGFKLLLRVKPALPHVDLNTELKEKIKAAMVKRYNGNTKLMNLSKFHTDPDLVDNCTVALFRQNMMLAVIDILAENVPELMGLDLSENKIYSLDHLSILSEKLPNLKYLNIGKNRIRELHHLNFIQGLKLEELVLDGNPVCDKIKDQTVYVRRLRSASLNNDQYAFSLVYSEVRKRFPKVMKLDGVDLPPPIVFDVSEDEFKLPPSKPNFLIAEEGMAVVRPFLEQYYQIYDSDNRQPLISAYHENANFSLTCAYPPGQSSTNGPRLANYISESRNLLRMRDPNRKQKMLFHGKLDVVSFLSKLPKTQHDPLSFAVDLSIFTPQLIMMTVIGLFLEPGPSRNQPLRSFNRAFVIVPYGGGFCIINEQLFVTNATEEQAKVAFKSPPPAVMSPPAPAPTPVPLPVTSSPQAVLIDDNTKQQMVEAFALQSGMNHGWARKCLDETQWNYQQASVVFTELNRQGTIPAEAFIK